MPLLTRVRSPAVGDRVDELPEAGTPSGDRARIQHPGNLFGDPSGVDALSEQVFEMQLRIPDLVGARCVDLTKLPSQVFPEILGVGEVPGFKVFLSIRAQNIGLDSVLTSRKLMSNRFQRGLGIRPTRSMTRTNLSGGALRFSYQAALISFSAICASRALLRGGTRTSPTVTAACCKCRAK